MDAREEKGLQIAQTSRIVKNQLGMWKVPSQTGSGISYVVSLDHGHPFCSCPDFEKGNHCKHLFAVEYAEKRETRPDGTTIETQAMRVTFSQDWPAYNAAQTHEQERFVELLSELCKGVVQPEQKGAGRRNHPLSAVIMGAACKVYSTVSGRRAMTDLRELETKGYLAKAPSYNSIFDYLENPALAPLLKTLIEESAQPLKAVETEFAVDSSGFSTSVYNRWFDAKYGKMKSEAQWVKAHLMCGVKTQIATSVEVTPTETADAPQLPALVKATAENFSMAEVSADKAYSSKKNLHAIDSAGAVPYIPFKSYSTGSQGHKEFDSLWQKMWHFYSFNKAAFYQHYHKRSNIETAMSMIKAKFGGAVRSKSPIAQVNEVLLKVLCHNICVLIQSIYEFGLEPTFWNCRAEKPVARQLALVA